ncbi:helix-turn-helix transcriptional regulator [Micromonospora fiedleri]|uniref:Helix-turn-helix transcriptional regulator n=1 Tax=Micromonospora fiedleri TaxID=1157498 RepID=A0ABS1UEK0_9ACTN|nr:MULTISPECIES: helix-turn-helix transcriptional regulator [Micromonospora]MBL6274774.1 helix-turn-helix transcriptional regulator [Micromonospora fiedleri]WSK44519.1 helix-turn-helix domain-containing protein [Micromonospora maris]
MVLLRRVIGDALRARRQGQHRTLREVSSAANVSLGYLSEIERGQKEPSSELLAAICDALGARLSELLREVSDTVALAEQLPGVLVPMQDEPAESTPVTATVGAPTNRSVRQVSADGVAVSVRQESPLKATLRSTRVRPADRTDRDVVCAA